ncbi:hypothetical protein GCM10009808_08580 [Microbacterium sediminicola]|uniref:Uncharacterized protein n=1 Tax=Microbacterium sediminicola TaxID=415210 RepID=A0ABP4TU02_9MICO
MFTAESIDFLNADGDEIDSLTYFDSTSAAVAWLTDALGAPSVSSYEGGAEAWPGTLYDWNGLELLDPDSNAEWPWRPEYWVAVTTASVNGVSILTVDGVRVGDSAPELEARFPDNSSRITVSGYPERLDIRIGEVPADPDDPAYDGMNYAVWLIAPDPATLITEFRTPSPNFGV